MKRTVFNCVRCFFILIAAFTLGLTLVYLIPNEALEPQYSKSVAQIDAEIEKEGQYYARYIFNANAAIMDNFMDHALIITCRPESVHDSALHAAMDIDGYTRYWHGYLLTLKPILTQFSYQQIRYINMFFLITAFCFCFSAIHREFSWVMALGFAISLIMCFLVMISMSLQYFSIFMILLAEMLAVLYVPRFRDPEHSAVLLFAGGMLTNFFDLLTAPLLTLGMPLILLISFRLREERDLPASIRRIIGQSIAWGLGYGTCWIAKWTLGTLILGKNVFKDAMSTAKFRVEGNEEFPLDRIYMLKQNIETYFFAKGQKPFILILLILLLLLFMLIRSHKKDWLQRIAEMTLIALFPYAWFMVFANHSQIHFFYTYRIQAISMFAVFAAFENAIERKGIRR